MIRKETRPMKQYLLLILSTILLCAACDDLLEEIPTAVIAKEAYYQNEADAEGAIVGAYSAFGRDYYGITYYLMEELHGDFLNGRGSQAPISNFARVLDNTNIARCATNWATLYTAVNRSNAVLTNVPNILDISDEARNRIMSEAYFLRAMAYFNLVRAYGGVPLRLNSVEDLSALSAPRASESEVYAQVISDALEAEKYLPESVGEQTGRASVYAAKMLLAQAYLAIEDWSNAAQKAEEIISSGAYSLVTVTEPDDFYQMFAAETHSEDIMSIHHSPTNLSEIQTYIHRGNVPPYNYNSQGFYAWLPDTTSWISTWDDNDLRKSFNLYTEYQDAEGNPVPLPSTSPILFKKFISDPDGLNIYSIPVFRYTEAFLIYAEAAAMDGGFVTPLALERLNIIKRRGYGLSPGVVSAVDYSGGMSLTNFRDVVIQERAYEFVLERRRWWDLKRTSKIQGAFSAIGKTYISERMLWPIPENEINNNPALTVEDQNPGY